MYGDVSDVVCDVEDVLATAVKVEAVGVFLANGG